MRRSPKLNPPEPPEPACLTCGSPEVTEETWNEGIPLCDQHDSETARRYQNLAYRQAQLAESAAQISMELSEYSRKEWDKYAETLAARRKKVSNKLRNVRDEIQSLQDECEHEHLDVKQKVFTRDDFTPETREEVTLPVVATYETCAECGFEDSRELPLDAVMELEVGEQASYGRLNVYRGREYLGIRAEGVSIGIISLREGSENPHMVAEKLEDFNP